MRPTVIMKAAMTLDGQIAAADGTSQWITSESARADGHVLRAHVDGVMVGAGTVIADDPQLTVRLDAYGDEQPTPVIVAGSRDIPESAALLERDPIIIATSDGPGRRIIAPGEHGRVDLEAGLEGLGAFGMRRLLVEGGATLHSSLLAADLIDQAVLYYGPLLAGGVGTPVFGGAWASLGDATSVRVESVRQIDDNVRVEVFVERPEPD